MTLCVSRQKEKRTISIKYTQRMAYTYDQFSFNNYSIIIVNLGQSNLIRTNTIKIYKYESEIKVTVCLEIRIA